MGRLSTDLFSLVETLSASSAPTIFQKKKETFASVLMTVLLLLSPSDVVRSEKYAPTSATHHVWCEPSPNPQGLGI